MIDPSEIAVLIPAAGRVPEGVLAFSNIGCPAMIPVAGRPVIHWTMQYLRSLHLQNYWIGVSRRGMFVEDFVECGFGRDCHVEFLVPPADGGVGRTLLELAERAKGNAALVVLGDTHFQFERPEALGGDFPFVLTRPVDDSYRWCTAELNVRGEVTALHDKEPDLTGPLDALIGVYYFPDLAALRNAARAAVAQATAAGRRTELADVLRNLKGLPPLKAIRAGEWLDCGNPDRQASSHRSLLQKRDFNELNIDPILGTVTKRSRHVEKFIDEINYLRLLPAELSVLFPRVLDYSTNWEQPFLTMEYYGYPTLAEIFVFENVDSAIWEQVFGHLRDIMTRGFMRHQRPLHHGALAEMYVGKTRRRLEHLQAGPELGRLLAHDGPITVNGRPLANIPQLWNQLKVETERLAANVQGAIIHGDLCLSNILYDLRARICKLIDPRGSFGAAGIFGDPRYDVAKLYHSIHGQYDFIMNDLFQVSVEGSQVLLDVRSRPLHQQIRERFEKTFFPLFDRREILLITGLLFASMPSLHYDAPRRQIAMYARALQLFDEALALAP